MKILKQTLTLFALLAVFSTATFAQENANVDASATVVAALSLNVTPIQFGSIQNNQAAELATTNVGTNSNVGIGGTTTQVGNIAIGGLANATLDVSFNNQAVLRLPDGTNPVTMDALVEYSGAEFLTGNTITLDGTGSANIEIGGQLPAISTAGTYSTTTSGTPLTFTFSYN